MIENREIWSSNCCELFSRTCFAKKKFSDLEFKIYIFSPSLFHWHIRLRHIVYQNHWNQLKKSSIEFMMRHMQQLTIAKNYIQSVLKVSGIQNTYEKFVNK